MKTCPNCKSEVEDNFEICWNCQYSFIDNKVIDLNDFKLVCPGCKTVVEETMHFCPVCRYDLAKFQVVKKEIDNKLIECLRCKIPLFLHERFDFQEGFQTSTLFTNRVSFDLYVCPKCRKVEFFLPE